jgi:lipoprotein NlpD
MTAQSIKTQGIVRTCAIAAVGVALVACGSSKVIREPGTSAPPPRVSTPKPGASAVVQKGDTLYGIAFRNGIDVRDLASWNRIGPPYTIYPGQRLLLYPKSGGYTATKPATPTTKPGAPRPTTPTTGTPTAPRPAPPAPPPATSPFKWTWPASGPILNGYVAGEPTKQGIDIGGASGDPVRAAGDGVVVYSGAGLVGYGELIIVKHNDAWLSAYGHNRARLVNEGQIVKAGQQIAELGRTGAAREMLHFEIRYNGKPVDPQAYLPKR